MEIIERVVEEVEDVAEDVEEVDIAEGDVAEADVEEAAKEDAEEDTEEDPKEDAEEDSEEGVEKKDEEVWVAKLQPFIWMLLLNNALVMVETTVMNSKPRIVIRLIISCLARIGDMQSPGLPSD